MIRLILMIFVWKLKKKLNLFKNESLMPLYVFYDRCAFKDLCSVQ